MVEEGPCLPHCYSCHGGVVALAYVTIIYACASVFYLVYTRSMGTPFADTLTEEQRQVKAESARKRGCVFMYGIIFSSVLLLLVKPFAYTEK